MDYILIGFGILMGFLLHFWLFTYLSQWMDRNHAQTLSLNNPPKYRQVLQQLHEARRRHIPRQRLLRWLEEQELASTAKPPAHSALFFKLYPPLPILKKTKEPNAPSSKDSLEHPHVGNSNGRANG